MFIKMHNLQSNFVKISYFSSLEAKIFVLIRLQIVDPAPPEPVKVFDEDDLIVAKEAALPYSAATRVVKQV